MPARQDSPQGLVGREVRHANRVSRGGVFKHPCGHSILYSRDKMPTMLGVGCVVKRWGNMPRLGSAGPHAAKHSSPRYHRNSLPRTNQIKCFAIMYHTGIGHLPTPSLPIVISIHF